VSNLSDFFNSAQGTSIPDPQDIRVKNADPDPAGANLFQEPKAKAF
jgi:hypothetical protein